MGLKLYEFPPDLHRHMVILGYSNGQAIGRVVVWSIQEPPAGIAADERWLLTTSGVIRLKIGSPELQEIENAWNAESIVASVEFPPEITED